MKRAASGAIAVLVSLVVAIVATEVILRASVQKLPVPFLIYLNADIKDRLPRTWMRIREALRSLSIRQEDPDAGWTFKPNETMSGRNEDGEAYTRTSSPEGFFTPDVPPKSTPQIITVGASFLATFYVQRPVQNVLRDALNIPVYNIAVGGWGPESYRAAYEKFGAGRRHDLVIVFTVPSDMSNVVNWNTWKAEESTESFMTWMQKTTASDDTVNRRQSWPNTHLVVWNLARFVSRPASARSGGDTGGGELSASTPHTMEHFGTGAAAFELRLFHDQLFMEHDPAYFLPGSDFYPTMQGYFESLVRMKASIEARHARMVLVWAPSKERVYVPVLPPARMAAYLPSGPHDVNGLEGAVERFATQEGITFFDLTRPLVERAARGENLYFTLDGHWNSHGNEVAGLALADFIRTLDHRTPTPSDQQLYLRRGPVAVERALPASAMSYRAAIVQPAAQGWRVRGRAEARFSYVAQWPETEVTAPQWLVATGVVRRGVLTFGVLKDNKWVLQYPLRRGRFDVALPVLPGKYIPIFANDLPADSLEDDAEISSFGWAALK